MHILQDLAVEEEYKAISARLSGLRVAYEMRAVTPKEKKIQKCRVRVYAFYKTLIIILGILRVNYDRVMEICGP